MRRLPELLVLAVCIVSAAVYPQLPVRVAPDVSWLLPFSISAPPQDGSRLMLALLIPAILVAIVAAFRWANTVRGKAATARVLPAWLGTPGGRDPEYEKFGSSMDLILVCIVALVSSIHLAFLASALRWTGPIASLVGIVFGVSLAAMGNVMPRLRPNPIAGLRTESMLGNSLAWRSAHVSFGRVWVVGGAVVVAVALLAPRYALVTSIGVMLISVIMAPLMSRRALDAHHEAAGV